MTDLPSYIHFMPIIWFSAKSQVLIAGLLSSMAWGVLASKPF